MSWFAKGNDPRRSELMSAGNEKTAYRFFLKKGETREVLFLDDPAFLYNEYSFKVGDDYKNYTSLGDACPARLAGHRPYPAEAYTVLDLTPWKDKEGKEHKFSKRLLVVKGKKMIEALAVHRQAVGGSLAGMKFKFVRTNADKSSAIGDTFIFVGKVKLDSLSEKDREPINYEEILMPPSLEKMKAIVSIAAAPQNMNKKSPTVPRSEIFDTPATSFGSEDEIPF